MKRQKVPRTCQHCAEPIPEMKHESAKYCGPNCNRKAVYHRKSPEERREINARSNRRRYMKDLLPRVRSICTASKEITPGSPLGQYLVAATLTTIRQLSRYRDKPR